MIKNTSRNTLSIISQDPNIFPTQESQPLNGNQGMCHWPSIQEAFDYLANKSSIRETFKKDIHDSQTPLPEVLKSVEAQHALSKGWHSLTAKSAKAAAAGQFESKDLLWAASMDDASMLQEIYNSAYVDVNVKGKFGETPLHVAAITGNLDGVVFLLKHGANPYIEAYKDYWDNGYTAFELALAEEHMDIVASMYLHGHTEGVSTLALFEHVVAHNMTDLLKLMIEKGEHLRLDKMDLEDLAWDKVFDLIDLIEAIHSDADFQTFVQIGATLELLAPLTGTVIGVDPWLDFEIPPMAVFLEVYAFDSADPRVHQFLMETAARIDSIDGNKNPYLMAKALFHILPVEGLFKINYNDVDSHHPKKAYIDGEGFYHIYTVPLAHASVQGFIDQSPMLSKIQMNAFEATLETLTLSAEHADKLGLASTAQAYYEAYQNGQTILLPSGWSGHAVDIIANKDQNVLIIANNGNRYDDLDSGVNIFMMPKPDFLTPDLIHDILVNQDQINLELKLSAKLGLVGYDSIVEPDQFTGNCAWQSHESAIEGVLYISLLEQGLSIDQAKALAHESYLAWDHYQTTAFVEGYFNDDPRIDSQAVTALIKTQAFLLETDDIQVVKADPIGHILVNAYEDMTHKHADFIQLDYNPFADWGMPSSWGDFGQTNQTTSLELNDILDDTVDLFDGLILFDTNTSSVEPSMLAPSLPEFGELEVHQDALLI